MKRFAVVLTAVALALVSFTVAEACGGMSTVSPPPFPGTPTPPGALTDISSPGMNTTTTGVPGVPGDPSMPGLPSTTNDPFGTTSGVPNTNPDDFFPLAGVDEVIL